MRLVFIYGPPAVGKLTVANALAKLTGYRVFHNHLTIDLVRSIFDWGEGPFFTLVDRYRLELIESAAKADMPGLIFTFVYAKDHDDGFVESVVGAVERQGGRVHFVRLTCTRRELSRRVRLPSRRAFRKMTDPARLKDLMKRYEVFSDVPYPNNLVIDTTGIRPSKAARQIATHYALPLQTGTRRPKRR